MEQKSNTWTIVLTIIITTVVIGNGVYWWQQNKATQEAPSTTTDATETATVEKEEPKGPLSYSTNGASISVSKKTEPFDYTVDKLVSMSQECGTNQTENYFSNLVSKFSGTTKTVYRFKYTGGASQGSDTFRGTLLPNKAGYSSLDQFKIDFDQCFAGGDAYPTMLNDNWLLFVNSCGTGFDDGSDNPVGCQIVRDVVGPTLKLN